MDRVRQGDASKPRHGDEAYLTRFDNGDAAYLPRGFEPAKTPSERARPARIRLPLRIESRAYRGGDPNVHSSLSPASQYVPSTQKLIRQGSGEQSG
jgi:hypothetical protein